MKRLLTSYGLFALLLCATQAQATLIGRGKLVYDTINNISWAQDAGTSELKSWPDQNLYAANLVFAGYDDFRLASLDELCVAPANGAFGSPPDDAGAGPLAVPDATSRAPVRPLTAETRALDSNLESEIDQSTGRRVVAGP